ITGRSNRGPREDRLCGAAAPAPPAFGHVLGDHQADLGKVEYLTAFGADDLSVVETGSTRRARGRCVVDHVIGIHHRGEVLARCPGLLALLATSGTTLGPRWRGRLREPFSRRRHRGVAGVPAETLLQVGQLRLEHRHLRPQQRVLGRDLLVGGSVGRGIAGWNSPRYARWSRRWWTRLSGSLNSYFRSKVDPLNRNIAALAAATHSMLIDFHAAVADGDQYRAGWSSDGIHPTLEAADAMAKAAVG